MAPAAIPVLAKAKAEAQAVAQVLPRVSIRVEVSVPALVLQEVAGVASKASVMVPVPREVVEVAVK